MRRLLALLLIAACGDSSSTMPDAASTADAAADASGLSTTCTGACQATSLTATMLATRTLDRAYYGVTASDGTLHVEAYLGGGTGCPTMNSPTPSYTLVLGRVPMPTSSAMSTSPGNFLDYEGDMLPNNMLGQAASSVAITPVAAMVGSFVALDIDLTFPAGTLAGHLYATHCDSLDDP